MVFDLEMIKKLYELYPQKVEAARTLLQKPLTLSEKNSLHSFMGR